MEFKEAKSRLTEIGLDINEEFWRTISGNLNKLNEARIWWDVVYGEIDPIIDNSNLIEKAIEFFPENNLDNTSWGSWCKSISGNTDYKGRDLFISLRKAITGFEYGPELSNLLPLIGKDKILSRMSEKIVMDFELFNTYSNKTELFIPLDDNDIRIYACGPTVYDYIHVGNARPLIIFDVLVRFLKLIYPKVTYVRNITDVDDKIIVQANQNKESINNLTERTIKAFSDDADALFVKKPDFEPRATEHIQEMLKMIKVLLENGNAYLSDGHVLFSVSSMPNYGKLSGMNLSEMIDGARVEVSDYKKEPADFVLWKPSKTGELGWHSDFGFGRPGWHIECSAMSKNT